MRNLNFEGVLRIDDCNIAKALDLAIGEFDRPAVGVIGGRKRRFTGLLDISTIEAGLQTVGWLRPEIDPAALRRKAAEQKVEVTPLDVFYRGSTKRAGLQLGFAAIGENEIRRGLQDLEIVLQAPHALVN